jgi:hypothetical protein
MRLALNALALSMICLVGGCGLFRAAPPPTAPLHEYLDGIATELRYRDELTWLKNCVAFHKGEPFVITMITGRDGMASIPLELTLSLGSKTTASGNLKASAALEIGVSGSAESSATATSKVTVNLVILDPGRFHAAYEDVKKILKRHPLESICSEVPPPAWKVYAQKHPDWWPAFYHFETNTYYSVDSRKRTKFLSMLQEIHAVKVEFPAKPPEEKKKEETGKD